MQLSPFFREKPSKIGKLGSFPDFDSNTHNHLKINSMLRYCVDIF